MINVLGLGLVFLNITLSIVVVDVSCIELHGQELLMYYLTALTTFTVNIILVFVVNIQYFLRI